MNKVIHLDLDQLDMAINGYVGLCHGTQAHTKALETGVDLYMATDRDYPYVKGEAYEAMGYVWKYTKDQLSQYKDCKVWPDEKTLERMEIGGLECVRESQRGSLEYSLMLEFAYLSVEQLAKLLTGLVEDRRAIQATLGIGKD